MPLTVGNTLISFSMTAGLNTKSRVGTMLSKKNALKSVNDNIHFS